MNRPFLHAILAAAALATAPAAMAQVSITLYPNLSPVAIPSTDIISPSVNPYRANVLQGISTGQPNVGGSQSTDPAAFNTIGQPIVNSEGHVDVGLFDVVGFPFHSWRGKAYSSGPFANEYGTFIRTSAHIESSSPFTAAEVKYGASDDTFQFEATLDNLITPGRYKGLYWGTDQIKGTPDDVVYDGDALTADAPLNEINTIGPGWMFYYTPDPAYTPQDMIKEMRDYITTDYKGAYSSRSYVTLGDKTSGVTFTATVPDSGPMGVVAAGALLGLIRFSNRRKS